MDCKDPFCLLTKEIDLNAFQYDEDICLVNFKKKGSMKH